MKYWASNDQFWCWKLKFIIWPIASNVRSTNNFNQSSDNLLSVYSLNSCPFLVSVQLLRAKILSFIIHMCYNTMFPTESNSLFFSFLFFFSLTYVIHTNTITTNDRRILWRSEMRFIKRNNFSKLSIYFLFVFQIARIY